MAIITISRQVAAHGDEVAAELARELGYKHISRKELEQRIIDLGFPESKMPKYDERKPGFFASLARDRDEYLNYVQYAILEAAVQKNVIIIGRGAFSVLENVPNHIAIRLVADEKTRIQRLRDEFNWDEKQAKQRISESDTNRSGFNRSFFNTDINDSALYHAVLNTGYLGVTNTAKIIASLVQEQVTVKQEEEGNVRIEKMMEAQKIVNRLIFEHHINIEFMHATIDENGTFILHGVADSTALVEQALSFVREAMPGVEVKSAVSIVHDFKAYQ